MQGQRLAGEAESRLPAHQRSVTRLSPRPITVLFVVFLSAVSSVRDRPCLSVCYGGCIWHLLGRMPKVKYCTGTCQLEWDSRDMRFP